MRKFNVDFFEKTDYGLTGLHCAAQRKEGIVSIYYMNSYCKKFNANITDKFGATPLHYAIMSIEESNIQALLSLKSDINAQDAKGKSMLHVALLRYIDDQ